jgi:hypothetical protein
VRVLFDDNKYFIGLDYEKSGGPFPMKSRKIIYDGSAVFTSMFSKDFHPKGCLGEIWENQGSRTAPREAQFPFDPSKLPDEIIPMARIMEKSGESIKASADREGLITGTYDDEFGTYRFVSDPKVGYNVSEFPVYLKDGKFLHNRTTAAWKNSGSVWLLVQLSAI